MYYYPQNNYNWAPQQEPQRVQQGYQQNMVQQQNMTPQQLTVAFLAVISSGTG